MTGKRFARLAAAVAVCLLVLAAFVVQLLGGRGSVPGWQQLRAALGVPLQTEESAPQTADGSTVVYVLDVGQGDAVLICQDGAYCLIDTGPAEAEEAPVCAPDARTDTVVVIASDKMGDGAEELGKTLLKAFVFSLTQQDKLPKTILFYNGGAHLTCEGSPMLDDLKALEAEGVEIVTCGTCLNFYGLTEKLQVGTVTNMYVIAEKMLNAGNVVKP